MPYESVADLPAYVKKLPDNKQRQWRSVFNSCMEDGKDEGACFRLANGVVKKEVQDWETENGLALADEVAVAEKSYQYVDSYEYQSRQISQEAASYNAVGGTGTKACSNCFFFVSPARCTVVSGEIAPNGLSSQWRAVPVPEQVPLPVVIVKGTTKGVNPIVSFVNKLRGVADPPVTENLSVVRQKDGSLRWFARYSNAWEDRDSEVITESAHKEYVEWATSQEAYPELWLWHTPGTRFGVADQVGFNDGFAWATGLIDEGEKASKVVESLKELGTQVGGLGVSHGFLHAKSGKYISKYRTFEISVLPLKRAAVWTTNFSVAGKEAMMAFSKDSRDFLVQTMGEDWVKQQEADQKEQADRLRALGVEYKSTAEREEEAAAEAAKAAAAAATSETAAAGEQFTAAFKAIGTQLTDLTAQVAALTGAVTSVKGDVDTLKKSDKERIDEAAAEVFKTRAAAPATRPTEDTSNILGATATKDTDPQRAADNWLLEMVSKGFGNLGQDAAGAGGVGTPAVAQATVTTEPQAAGAGAGAAS